ncbi:MAG: hypothetical protein NTX11_00105 [Candidatus Saccharibacteria bacterium]|nr:hypothetical protein [Candidatus Saccharibacteria bacterium]
MKKQIAKLRGFIWHNRLLFSLVATSLVAGAAFLNQHLYGLIFVSFLPFIYALEELKKYSVRSLLKMFYFSGYIFALMVLILILQPADSTWTQSQGAAAVYIKIFAWLISAAVFALGSVVTGYLCYTFRNRTERLRWLLLLILPLSELIRTWLFAVYSYGPGGSLSPNFNLGTIGLPAAASPLVFLSRFGGLYGLSLLVILINLLIYKMLTWRYHVAMAILVPVVALNILAYYIYQPGTRSLRVAAVHLNEDETLEKWPNIPYPEPGTNLLALPEYSVFLKGDLAKKSTSLGNNTTVITSVEAGSKPHTNALTYFNKNSQIINQQDKTYLIPSGEYIPYFYEWTLRLLKMDAVVTNFNSNLQVKKGTTPERVVNVDGYVYGALACSGVVNLSQYTQLSGEGADVLVNVASLSFLSSGSTYHIQEKYFARFHAVSNARPFVQASRSGQSYIIDSNGTVQAYTSGKTAIIQGRVSLVDRRTLHTLLRIL